MKSHEIVSYDDIIESAIKSSIKKLSPQKEREPHAAESKLTVTEAYVAEPKPYGQVTEFLSQKTKDAHVALYKSYIETLNRVSAELDSANRQEVNPRHCEFRSLKLDEVYNLNATWLHELYFANCFDPHSEVTMDSITFLRLERDFGNFEDFQRDFIACALASGEGWVVCGYHVFLKRYMNVMISHHSNDIPVGFYPIIVVDMWSHAYYRDYLTDKKSYLISQMREFNWNVIDERVKKAEAIAEVTK